MPDEFFDEIVEAEKEFCDISMSLIHKRGLEGINSIHVSLRRDDVHLTLISISLRVVCCDLFPRVYYIYYII